jgi:hypothetical protein
LLTDEKKRKEDYDLYTKQFLGYGRIARDGWKEVNCEGGGGRGKRFVLCKFSPQMERERKWGKMATVPKLIFVNTLYTNIGGQ